ncbi:hypothetical protein RAF62_27325, partial [Klebsiella pneumoniae]
MAKKISENALWMTAVAPGSMDELYSGGGRCDGKNEMLVSSRTIPQSTPHGIIISLSCPSPSYLGSAQHVFSFHTLISYTISSLTPLVPISSFTQTIHFFLGLPLPLHFTPHGI